MASNAEGLVRVKHHNVETSYAFAPLLARMQEQHVTELEVVKSDLARLVLANAGKEFHILNVGNNSPFFICSVVPLVSMRFDLDNVPHIRLPAPVSAASLKRAAAVALDASPRKTKKAKLNSLPSPPPPPLLQSQSQSQPQPLHQPKPPHAKEAKPKKHRTPEEKAAKVARKEDRRARKLEKSKAAAIATTPPTH